MEHHNEKPITWRTPEFLLVIVMLVVLTALVFLVMLIKIEPNLYNIPKDLTPESAKILTQYSESQIGLAKDILEYRKSIISILIAAFGAWVGAGAAYYFGRENLRESTRGLLAMREPTAREKLNQTLIRDMTPRSLDWSVPLTEKLYSISKTLKNEVERWFIPIVKPNGELETVVHAQAVWRFIDSEVEKGTTYNDVLKKTLADVVTFIDAQVGLHGYKNIHINVDLDKSAGVSHEMMLAKGAYLAIVRDDADKPTHYFTTGDLRKVLLEP